MPGMQAVGLGKHCGPIRSAGSQSGMVQVSPSQDTVKIPHSPNSVLHSSSNMSPGSHSGHAESSTTFCSTSAGGTSGFSGSPIPGAQLTVVVMTAPQPHGVEDWLGMHTPPPPAPPTHGLPGGDGLHSSSHSASIVPGLPSAMVQGIGSPGRHSREHDSTI